MTGTEARIITILLDEDLDIHERVTKLAEMVEKEHEMTQRHAIQQACRFVKNLKIPNAMEAADQMWEVYESGGTQLR
jgi:predicted transcriptional regulator